MIVRILSREKNRAKLSRPFRQSGIIENSIHPAFLKFPNWPNQTKKLSPRIAPDHRELRMIKILRIIVLIVLISLVARIRAGAEDDDESVCKMETKKGLVQLKEKYKERIQAWKELQKRGCAGEL